MRFDWLMMLNFMGVFSIRKVRFCVLVAIGDWRRIRNVWLSLPVTDTASINAVPSRTNGVRSITSRNGATVVSPTSKTSRSSAPVITITYTWLISTSFEGLMADWSSAMPRGNRGSAVHDVQERGGL